MAEVECIECGHTAGTHGIMGTGCRVTGCKCTRSKVTVVASARDDYSGPSATSERAAVVAYERGWLDAINALLVECVKRRDAFREAAKTTDREKWAEYLTIAIENDQLCGQLRDRIEDRKNLHVRAKGG